MIARDSSAYCKEHKSGMIKACLNEECSNQFICEKCYLEKKGRGNICTICNGYLGNDKEKVIEIFD